jgi:hypothetical protein
VRPELFHSDEETNLSSVECKLCSQSCIIRADFIKDRGEGVLIDSKLHFNCHLGHVFFFKENKLYGLIGFVTFSVSFLDSQLMLV